MSAPVRIQRKRVRGWQKPANTICVNRGTPYGNPFVVMPDKDSGSRLGTGYICVPTLEDAIACFREYVDEAPELKAKITKNLRGKNLACFCALDQACHADVLLEIANQS